MVQIHAVNSERLTICIAIYTQEARHSRDISFK